MLHVSGGYAGPEVVDQAGCALVQKRNHSIRRHIPGVKGDTRGAMCVINGLPVGPRQPIARMCSCHPRCLSTFMTILTMGAEGTYQERCSTSGMLRPPNMNCHFAPPCRSVLNALFVPRGVECQNQCIDYL